MTGKMKEKLYSALKLNIATWLNLCKFDTDTSLILCDYFTYKDFAELKTVCPAATVTRGRVFHRARYLTDSLLRELLGLIRGGAS